MKLRATHILPAMLLALSGCGESAAQRLERAQDAFARQDYQAARVTLAAGLRDEPGNVAMLTLMARTQLRLRDPEGAKKAIAALAGKADPTEFARLQAELLLLQGRAKDALAAIPAGDGDAVAWRIRAAAWLALGNEGEAVDAFGKGMAGQPDIAIATDYARYLLQSDRIDAAARVHRDMRRFAPGAFETLVLEGDLAEAQGRSQAAIAAYRQAVQRYPGRYEPLLALATQLDEQGKVHEAMALVERAEALAANAPGVFEMRMQLLSEQGKWTEIRSAMQGREAGLDPASSLGLTYGEALLRLGYPEQARTLFQRALLLMPGNPFSRLMLGEAQLATNDAASAWKTLAPLGRTVLAPPDVIDAAARAAEAARAPEAGALRARLEPSRLRASQAQIAQAQASLNRQDWDAAVTAYQRIPGGGDDPEVLKRLAYASSEAGHHAEAIAYADRALAREPDNSDYLHMAGFARLRSGDRVGAVKFLQRAVDGAPRQVVFRTDLKKALSST